MNQMQTNFCCLLSSPERDLSHADMADMQQLIPGACASVCSVDRVWASVQTQQ